MLKSVAAGSAVDVIQETRRRRGRDWAETLGFPGGLRAVAAVH